MREKEKRQKLIETLNLMIRDANKRKGGEKRIEIIYRIDALATFMYYTGMIKEHEYVLFMKKINNISDELRLVYKRRNEIFEELYDNNSRLLALYDNALSVFDSVPNKTYDTTVDHDKLIKATVNDEDKDDFLKYINCYSIYKECKNNERLVRGSILTDNETIDNIDCSYIVLGQYPKNSFEYFSSMVHAIAHAYVNKVMQSKNMNYYDGELFCEVIPRFFEWIYIDYLSRKKILSKDKIQNIMLNQKSLVYYHLNRALEVAKIMETQDYCKMNYLKYQSIVGDNNVMAHHATLGDLLSLKLFQDYKKDKQDFIQELPYVIEKLMKMNLEGLINEYYDVNAIEKKMIK